VGLFQASMGSGRGDRNQLGDLLAGVAGLFVASMGSGRGDRNQFVAALLTSLTRPGASMGSGRGDRNQLSEMAWSTRARWLQWGPVVVTGISPVDSGDRPAHDVLQWGPVVVTGISTVSRRPCWCASSFNGVRSW